MVAFSSCISSIRCVLQDCFIWVLFFRSVLSSLFETQGCDSLPGMSPRHQSATTVPFLAYNWEACISEIVYFFLFISNE